MLIYVLNCVVVAICCCRCLFFFFSSRRRHTRYWRDWSSDVCSSDLTCPRRRPTSSRTPCGSLRPGNIDLRPERSVVHAALEENPMTDRPPLPPFTAESAAEKARLAEDGWNSRDPEKVSLAYTGDTYWRNRVEFINGRRQVVEFLHRKWARELEYRLIKELWAFHEDRIAVRYAYEWHDDSGRWFRSYGNENWEFDEHGLDRKSV